MVDVLLINPGYGNGATHSAFPLGLGYIASMLRVEGYVVGLVDLGVESIDLDLIKKAKVVGIGIMSPALQSTYKLIEKIKKLSTRPEIIVGGPHVTDDPEIVVDLGVRYGIRGEADHSFVSLCDSIIKSEKKEVPGLVLNDGGEINVGDKVVVDELDDLPFPTRHLITQKTYEFTPMITSRGCPFKCAFCSMSLTKYRSRSPGNVFFEVKELREKYGIRKIDFVDDVFTLDRENIVKLSELLRKDRVRTKWSCTTRVDLVDRELLEEMYESGLWFISFGVESGSENIRRLSGKDIPNKIYKEVFKLCREIGIRTRAYAMFGHPTESTEGMERTITFMKSLNPDYVVFRVTDLVPGSMLFKRTILEKKVKKGCWRDYMLGGEYPIYLPDGITKEDIYNRCDDAYRSFYFRREYIFNRLLNMKFGSL